MNTLQFRRLTSLVLIITPIVFIACFALLQAQFDYPAILRNPADVTLRKFHAGGVGLIAIWYGITLSALLFIPLTVMLYQLLAENSGPVLKIATVFGIVAGVVQVLGFVRWPFLVPYLAATYQDASVSEATRASVLVVFEAFHRYAGVAIGEHLGYLCTSIWAVLIGLEMRRSPLFTSWLAWPGVVLALGIFLGIFEMAGWEAAGTINAISYLLWALWLVLVGGWLLLGRSRRMLVASAV